MNNLKTVKRISKVLGYSFENPDLVAKALTHRSYSGKNNERLEFLGDSILNYIIAEALYDKFPKANEGQLSRLRSSLVKGATLAELGKEFGLGDYLLLGSGELRSGGFRRESILADAVEALIAAIYQEAGMDACRDRVLVWYKKRLDELTLDAVVKDPKTRLQEYLQGKQLPLPTYRVDSIMGEAHAQQFTVHCQVSGLNDITIGTSSSRRGAEQSAASKALKALGLDPSS